MTEATAREYFVIQQRRYRRAARRERSRIIDEAVEVTGWHRKSVIRRLGKRAGPVRRRAGRPPVYGPAVGDALLRLWRISGELSSILLRPLVPQLITSLKEHGELSLDPAIEAQLLTASRSTIERLLATRRPSRRMHGQTLTRPGTVLRHSVPIRTWSEWGDAVPGDVGIDLAGHGGESAEGFFLFTLTMTDVVSGWTELEPVWGKGEERVGSGVHRARLRLPMPVTSFHSDNGSEFINHAFVTYCRKQQLRFTRSRPYRKNDNAHTEQKNGALVRRLIGYDRYNSRAAYEQLGRVYALIRLRSNYFQPQQHLVNKERNGARVTKRYDAPQTPADRLLASGVLDTDQVRRLEEERARINPVQLSRDIDRALNQLWDLAAHPPYGARERSASARDVG